MLKFSRDHMWKFQGWNRCDSHVRIGVIDLVRERMNNYTILFFIIPYLDIIRASSFFVCDL